MVSSCFGKLEVKRQRTSGMDCATAGAATRAPDLTIVGSHCLGLDRIDLLGFSMGMAVASTLMRHRPEEFAAVVGLSGFVVPAEGNGFFHDEELAELKVPFFWGRDQEDPIIPQEHVDYTHRWANSTVKLTKVLYAGAGHGVVPQEVGHINEFLTQVVLKGRG